ncbi:murein transglycosylase A [Azospira restricta]|uniref:peptidoglycan lytic exotransglycosylase n=1 Tax=Azospira restricta TaxID=404405 RepID=A0A974Y3S7_9RHOO|nr:murein transglycosylase A [Azospira restricta]QRJ63981.1 murein transglycosylase A [Azospira restricta]
MKKFQPAALALLLLAACAAPRAPQPAAPTAAAPCPACAPCPKCPGAEPAPPAAKPLQPARWEDIAGWQEDDLRAAWPAFQQSCRGLAGKPQWPLWQPACEAARAVDANDAGAVRRFFEKEFLPFAATNPEGTSEGLVTGYYEPLLAGARKRSNVARYPLHAVPRDLLTIELADVLPELKGKRLRGRLVGNKVVPYWSRAEIVEREQSAPVLLWVEDAVEAFFLQIQGSGRVRLPSGEMIRVGYADQNGHPYQSIGRVLLERGDLQPGEASMQGIQAWARANPQKLDELLNTNPSYVFFRELPAKFGPDDGPPGALGVPLVAERTIAVDPRHIPLGAPVFLATTRPNSDEPLRRLVMAQDTGGAIKGVVRADFFWGFGAEAGAQAGRMKQSGRMWVLLPPGAAPK